MGRVDIGNLDLAEARVLASEFGFGVFLCGAYVAHSLRGVHREFLAGEWQELPRMRSGKVMRGVVLPPRLWYCEELDVLSVVVAEDYCLGQTSAAYFGPTR